MIMIGASQVTVGNGVYGTSGYKIYSIRYRA